MQHPIQIVFDANDPTRLAEFWALALGYVFQPPPPGYDEWEAFAVDQGIPEDLWDAMTALVDPDGDGPRILFQKVPEGKVAKNRVHLDVHVPDSGELKPDERQRRIEALAADLAAAGATEIDRFDEPIGWWIVMQDPEGNEFCVA
jgi:Glyoxalase-like domain